MGRKYSYIGMALIVLIFGTYVARNLDDRISNKSVVEDNRLNRKKKTEQTDTNRLFLYRKVPPFEFTNQDGKLITNKSYAGKVYVVEFFFTTCPSICPVMTQKMLDIQKEFSGQDQVGMASISITPRIDTPKVLKEYAKNNGITHENWHLLTGQPEQTVYDLSNEGFKLYAGLESDNFHGGFEHAGLFALVDQNGMIRSRKGVQGNPILYYRAIEEAGFPDQIRELKEDIKILLNEPH